MLERPMKAKEKYLNREYWSSFCCVGTDEVRELRDSKGWQRPSQEARPDCQLQAYSWDFSLLRATEVETGIKYIIEYNLVLPKLKKMWSCVTVITSTDLLDTEPSPIGRAAVCAFSGAKQDVPCCKTSNQDEILFLPQGAPFSCLGYGKFLPFLNI